MIIDVAELQQIKTLPFEVIGTDNIDSLNDSSFSFIRADVSRECLESVAAETDLFQLKFEGDFCKFELRKGTFGKREVQFTLKGGIAGLRLAYSEMSAAMKKADNYSARFELHLSENSYLNLPYKEDIRIIYTPVINNSGNRVRLGSDSDTSHQGLLKRLGLEFVPNDLHRLACAALRVSEGFPPSPEFIGTNVDHSDLNEGKVVRTAEGYKSGLVATYITGIATNDWNNQIKFPQLVVAGMSYRNY